MVQSKISDRTGQLGPFAIAIHLGMLLFGIAALLTGELADDYKKALYTGFTVHSWIGVAAVLFALLRLLTGIFGPVSVRFTQWMPFTRSRMAMVREDIAGLLRFRLPERPTHQGLAGLVQTFGLAVFFLMAATGAILYFGIEPGRKAHGFLHQVKEVHELGMALLPAFLGMHVGAVIMHALAGRHLWRKILFISDTLKERSSQKEPLTGER